MLITCIYKKWFMAIKKGFLFSVCRVISVFCMYMYIYLWLVAKYENIILNDAWMMMIYGYGHGTTSLLLLSSDLQQNVAKPTMRIPIAT